MILTLPNLIAFFAFLLIVLSFWDDFKNHKKSSKAKTYLTIIAALIILGLTVVKDCQDYRQAKTNKIIQDSLIRNTNRLTSQNASIFKKLDISNAYLQRLDSIGITRDTITNQPIFTNKFSLSENKIDNAAIQQGDRNNQTNTFK